MRKLNNKTDNSVPIPALINSETGNIVFSNADKANLLNKFFCSISNIDDVNADIPVFHSRCENKTENIPLPK